MITAFDVTRKGLLWPWDIIISLERQRSNNHCKATILSDYFQSDDYSMPSEILEGTTYTSSHFSYWVTLIPKVRSTSAWSTSNTIIRKPLSVPSALTLILKASLHQGELPPDWKRALHM